MKSFIVLAALFAITFLATQSQAQTYDIQVPQSIAMDKCLEYKREIQASKTLSASLTDKTQSNLCTCMESEAKANAAIAELYKLQSWPSRLESRLMSRQDISELYEAWLRSAYYKCISTDIDRALDPAIREVPTQHEG